MKKNLSHIIYSRLLEIELKPDVYFAATLDKSNLFFSFEKREFQKAVLYSRHKIPLSFGGLTL